MAAVKKLEDRKWTYADYITWENDEEDWEIIDGIAYAMSPSVTTKHQNISTNLVGEFYIYLKGKTCKVYSELDVVLSNEDIVRPDVIIVCDKNKMTDANIKGAPDLIAEILSPSTSKRDRTTKLELYKKFGVKEYWVVDPIHQDITVYNFSENTQIHYFYDEEEKENFIPVAIFGGDLKLDLKNIFGS